MHILLLTDYWPPEIGAAAHLFVDLAHALTARGHRFAVLTGFPRYHVAGHRPGACSREECPGAVRIRRVHRTRLPQHLPAARGLGQFLDALVYAMAGSSLPRPDLLLAYSPPLPMGLSADLLARRWRCPFVLNVQDIFPQCAIDLGVLRQRLLIRFFEGLERYLYHRASGITVHSEGNGRYIRAKLPPDDISRVAVVPNWVDVDALQSASCDGVFRQQHGLGDAFVVSFAGTMGYSQDLDTVLQAAALLRHHPAILFLLAGEGVELPRLRRLAAELRLSNVRWLPLQPRPRYAALLRASDLCLVTLRDTVRTPAVPSKLMSIMAAARPALLSVPLDGDAPALVRAAQCGLCAPPANPPALAEAILRLHHDRPLAYQLGQNGRGYLLAHLTVTEAARRYEALFARLLDRARSDRLAASPAQ